MKFTLTFKTPDVLDRLDEQFIDSSEAKQFAEQYIVYGEYITIEFDTEAETAIVLSSRFR